MSLDGATYKHKPASVNTSRNFLNVEGGKKKRKVRSKIERIRKEGSEKYLK
jgi:hypothetical protein